MSHDEYWNGVMRKAERNVVSVLGEERVNEIVGDGNGIDDDADARGCLAYALKCGTYGEAACVMLSLCDWRQARHEQIVLQKVNQVAQDAANGISALSAQVAAITKTVVAKDAICHEVMARYNSWTAPTATATA